MNVLKISFAIAAECDSLPRCLTRSARKLFLPLPHSHDRARSFATLFHPFDPSQPGRVTLFHSDSLKEIGKMDAQDGSRRAGRWIDIYIYIRRARREAQATRTNGIQGFIPRKWYTSVTPVRPYVASIKILRATLSSTLRSLLFCLNLILPVNFCFVLDDV